MASQELQKVLELMAANRDPDALDPSAGIDVLRERMNANMGFPATGAATVVDVRRQRRARRVGYGRRVRPRAGGSSTSTAAAT